MELMELMEKILKIFPVLLNLPDEILGRVESEARGAADQVEDDDDGEGEDGVAGDFR